MKLVMPRTSLAAGLAVLALTPGVAAAAPVATDDGSYQGLGRVYPDPQGACNQGPCSPHAQGNVPATTFLSYSDFIAALKYMNDPTKGTGAKTWQHYMEVWTLDGDLDGNDDTKAGTDEKANFPGDNLGSWEFTPDGAAHSAGLPTSDTSRLKSDVVVVRVTDESVPDAGKQRMALSLSIHGIERAGVEGGTRAMEDLVTAATTGKLDTPILGTKGLGVKVPTFKEVLKKTIIYFTYPNPDGWRRGDTDQDKGPGVYFQRYNGNGVDVNRDFPDIGFAFRRYSGLSEPESRGWSSAFRQIKSNFGPFSAGDDLHGQLGADSFSFTLLPHGSHDYAKNERIRNAAQSINLVQQDVLSWSPIIQPNDKPRGSCNNKPVVGADCYPMYGQSWGSVYDTINYTTTGALGDFMDSSIGLNADGIDNEMSYSHLDKDIAFDPVIEQMHVDGNKGLIYAHLTRVLNPGTFVFPARGRHGYVPNLRVKRAASTTTAGAPPGTHAQEDFDTTIQTPSGSETQVFTVKQGGDIYNGGMRIDVTSQNIQGIDPTAQTGKTLQIECKGCDKHRGVPDADEKDWTVVADDFNQSGIYAQAGLTAAVNDPQSSGGATSVEWRAKVSGAPPGMLAFHVEFTQGPATSDGATGGDAAPRLAAYDVASTDFWKKLDPFTVAGAGFEAVDADKLAKEADAQVPSDLDTLVLSDQPLPGYVFGALPALALPADVKDVKPTRPSAPCGYTDGLPHSPSCGESFDFKFTETGLGRFTVSMTPDAGDLTLTVVQVADDGTETPVGPTSDQGGDGGTETVAVAYPDPGTYRAYVDNWAATPDASGWTANVHYEAPSIGPVGGTSTYTDDEWQRYADKLKTFVSNGGNLVLTDGALQALPFLFTGIKRTDVTRSLSYVGQVAFTTKATSSQDAPTDGNTLADPLAKNVALQGARFNTGLRRQTFEPTPIGVSIQDATGGNASNSPQWLVGRKPFEAAGGRITATGTSGEGDLVSQVTVGELKLGKGVVRIVGALLPEPTEAFDHQEGLEPFAVTYTGYTLAQNVTDYCAPSHDCVNPKVAGAGEVGPAGSSAKACIAARGFRSAAVKGNGKGLKFSFKRSGTAPVHVDLFQVSKGRRVLHERLIARFVSRKAISWNGGKRTGFAPSDGYYFARFRVKAPSGFTQYKRIALRRNHGRWSRQHSFFGTETCSLLRQFKLTRMVFGGSNRTKLGISYLLARSAPVTITVTRGKKTVAKLTRKHASGRKIQHVTLNKRSLKGGLYRVRIVAGNGKSAKRATLYSRKI